MLFNETDKQNLINWGCDSRELTIRRLGYVAMFTTNPTLKDEIKETRNKLIEEVSNAQHRLYYDNVIKDHHMWRHMKDSKWPGDTA